MVQIERTCQPGEAIERVWRTCVEVDTEARMRHERAGVLVGIEDDCYIGGDLLFAIAILPRCALTTTRCLRYSEGP